MTTEETTEVEDRPPHKWVADQIDFSIAGVSLLRSGHRKPSLSTIKVIEEKFGWPATEQLDLIWAPAQPTAYAEEFEKRICEKFKEETK